MFSTDRQDLVVNINVKCNSCAYDVSEYNSSILKECKGKRGQCNVM